MHARYDFDTGTFIDEHRNICRCNTCTRYLIVDSLFDGLEGAVISAINGIEEIFIYARAKYFKHEECPHCHRKECIQTTSFENMQQVSRFGRILCYVCHRCDGCCTCNTCRCKRRTAFNDPGFCGPHNACEQCDTCQRCQQCRRTYQGNRVCTNRTCRRCFACCECETQPLDRVQAVARVAINAQPHHRATRINRRINPVDRLVSVEIEVAGVLGRAPGNVTEICRRWGANIVDDGSLPAGGFEINSAPASGDLFVKEITEITKVLKLQHAFANERCGLHTHIDARDFSFYDMRRLIFLYEKIEPALFSMVPEARRRSKYCYPCGPRFSRNLRAQSVPKVSKNAIYRGIYGVDGRSVQERKKNRRDEARYNALNIHSWFVRGTTECRIRHGTVDRDEILNWAMLWAGILDFALKTPENHIHKLASNTMAERKEILKGCCPTVGVVDYVDGEFRKHNPRCGEITLNYRTFNA